MANDGKTPIYKRRWFRRTGWTLGILVVLFVLVVFVLPSPVARWVIASQLDDLGIEHEGVGTVSIDLWNRHVSAGPITFHDNGQGPAKIGGVDIDYSLANLFEKRALIETFTITGVDIVARRDEHGNITVNGIAPPAAEEPEQPAEADAEPEEKGSGFGVGVTTFVFQDSKLILQDFTGGTLTLDMKRLELSDFRSWQPDSPGKYSLAASLNGTVIEAAGEATPFAETIHAKGNISISSLTLDGVSAFVGPTGLERQGGAFSLVLQHEATLAGDGEIKANLNGTAVIRDVDIATPEGEAVTLAELENPFDSVVTVSADNALDVAGKSEFIFRNLALQGAKGETLKADEIAIKIAEMDLQKLAALREGMSEAASAAAQSGAATGSAESLIHLALDLMINAGKEVLRHQLEGSAALTVAMTGIDASEPGSSSAVKLATGNVAAGKIHISSSGPFWKLTTPLAVKLDGLNADSPGGKADIQQITADIGAFTGETNFDKATLSLDLGLDVSAVSASGGGAQASFDSLSLQVDPLSIVKESGVGTRTGPGTLETDLKLDTRALHLAANGADVRLDSLALQAGQVKFTEDTDWSKLEGMLKADLGALQMKADGASASLASLAFQADSVKVTGKSEIEAAVNVDTGKLNVQANGSTASLNALSVRAPRLKAGGKPGAATLDTALSLDANGVDLAAGGDKPASLTAKQLGMSFDPLVFAQESGSTKLSGTIKVTDTAAEADGATATVGSLILALKSIAGQVIPAPDLKGAATLSVGNISLSQPAAGATASVDSVEIQADSLHVSDAENALSGEVKTSGVKAQMEGDSPVTMSLAGASVTGLAATLPKGAAPSVAMNTISLDGLDVEANIAAFGKEGSESAPASSGGDSESGATPKVSVQTFTLSPGSKVTVLDSSTGEALRIPVTVEKLVAGPVDTAAPGKVTDIDLALVVGDASKVTAAGTATPLASTPDFDMQTNVAAFPLALVSPFVTQLSGLTVESGTLDVTANGKAVNNALDGKIDVRVADFYLGEPDSETAAHFQEDFGVPIGFAVGILKDSDGVIALSLPVSGTVTEPSVDYSEVISKAIGGALTSIFPSGLFSSDAGFSIKPVLFQPGTAELTEEGKAAADPLVSALKAKPEIKLRVCGKGARADLLVMRKLDPAGPLPAAKVTTQEAQDLVKLAQDRGGALRQYLVGQGVAEQRIGECRTSYSVESDAPPRAEVQL